MSVRSPTAGPWSSSQWRPDNEFETDRFTSLAHAQIVIEAWRREYNEDRPKQGLGGLTPAQYARQLVTERSTLTPGL